MSYTLPPAYAEIHLSDGTSDQAIPTGLTYTKIDSWDDNGFSYRAIADQANNKLTLLEGTWQVSCSLSFTCDTNNVEWYIAAFLNGDEYHQVHFVRKIGTAGDIGSAAMTGILRCSGPCDLDIRARHNNGGSVDLQTIYGNLNAFRLGR